jgi:DNA-binding MarR family transcriptional regulator
MGSDPARAKTDPGGGPAGRPPSSGPAAGLGPALRRAWLGYQLRLDTAMAEAGFGERRFPDGRVLRLCAATTGSTIAAIGRELGITRQGAAKVVGRLTERGYVTVGDSATSKREKCVVLTARGHDYLHVQRTKTREMEDELRTTLGDEAFAGLGALLEALDVGEDTRLRTYLQRSVGGA